MRRVSFPPLAALCLSLLPLAAAHADWVKTAGPPAGEVSRLAVDPSNGYVFATVSENAYRSRDQGVTWEAMYAGIPGDAGITGTAAASGTAYAFGVLGAATVIYRSTNAGDTWHAAAAAGLPFLSIIRTMLIDGTTLLVGIESQGVYRSTNAGDSWAPSSSGLPAGTGIGQLTKRGSDLYAGNTVSSPVEGIFRSTDGGATWTATNVTFLAGFAYLTGLASNANGVFATSSTTGIYRTTNDGTSWEKVNADMTSNFPTSLTATSANVFAGIAGGRVYRADASGNGWTAVNSGLPPTNAGVSVLAVATSGPSLLAGFGKIGIVRSTNAGDGWVVSNAGLASARAGDVLASGPYLFATAEQVGFFRSSDNGDSWVELANGVTPYSSAYAFAKTGSVLLGGGGAGALYRSSDDGDLWLPSNTNLGLTATFDLEVDPDVPSTVFAGGYYGVSKSIDSGLNWTPLNTGFGFTQTVLDVWKEGPYMLAGANAGIKRSTDGGDTWTAPMSGLPGGGGFGAFVSAGGAVYVTTSLGGVYRSLDQGATWTPRTTGLLAATSLLAYDGVLFAGSSTGVYSSSDGGGSWIAVNEGFPGNLYVVALGASSTHLYAGTLKSGVWRRPFSDIVTPALASLVSATAEPGRVRVRWFLGEARAVEIDRRTPDGPWSHLQSQVTDGTGYVSLEDSDVTPGGRYGYRVRWAEGNGQVAAGETWVDVPVSATLELHGTRPHPSAGELTASFTIPSSGRATLELYDVHGRRIRGPRAFELAGGTHTIPLRSWTALSPGVYLLRLGFGAEARTARIVVVP